MTSVGDCLKIYVIYIVQNSVYMLKYSHFKMFENDDESQYERITRRPKYRTEHHSKGQVDLYKRSNSAIIIQIDRSRATSHFDGNSNSSPHVTKFREIRSRNVLDLELDLLNESRSNLNMLSKTLIRPHI